MKYRRLKDTDSSTVYQTRFGGINKTNGAPLGEWNDTHNMTAEKFPAICNCRTHRYEELPNELTGFTFKNGFKVYTVPDGIYYGTKKIDLSLSEGRKKLVSMGAYIIILPDWIVVNTKTISVVETESAIVTGGTLIERNTNRTYPDVYINKDFYFEISSDNSELQKFSAGDTVNLSYTYKGKAKSLMVTIEAISSDESYLSEGKSAIIFSTAGKYSDTRYFYTENKPMTDGRDTVQFENVRLEKSEEILRQQIPDMDYELVIEHNNRLWGCSSKNHEIYCSKLGEPLVWTEYSGISTDSYAVTVGSDGDFTGSAVYNDCMLFFKEHCVHIVYGTKASNFTLSTVELRGVQKGSPNSVCISNGLLYYKAKEGIYAFNGSTAVRVDNRLGKDIYPYAVGVANDNMVYMATEFEIYAYDCIHDLWHKETIGQNGVGQGGITQGFNFDGCLYFLTMGDDSVIYRKLYRMWGNDSYTGGNIDDAAGFAVETGDINSASGTMQHISKLKFVIGTNEIYKDVTFYIDVSYDGGEYQRIYSYNSDTVKPATDIFTVPIIPKRCRTMKIRIVGHESVKATSNYGGPSFTLYGIYYNTEGGTELG